VLEVQQRSDGEFQVTRDGVDVRGPIGTAIFMVEDQGHVISKVHRAIVLGRTVLGRATHRGAILSMGMVHKVRFHVLVVGDLISMIVCMGMGRDTVMFVNVDVGEGHILE